MIRASAPAPPPNVVPPLLPVDTLRLKLVQLIDQISQLEVDLYHSSISTAVPTSQNPGTLPFTDLLSRYNILLSHLLGLNDVLNDRSSQGSGSVNPRGLNEKKTRWDSTVVVPAETVEESRDWIVGMLLRTKQVPPVEAHQAALQAALPAEFADPAQYPLALLRHTKLTNSAYDSVRQASEAPDRDWTERILDIEDEEEDEDEDEDGNAREPLGLSEDINMFTIPPVAPVLSSGKKWTLAETSKYERTGILPA